MANGTFQKGTWNRLPSNCSRDYGLTYTRCSTYGMLALTECIAWLVDVVRKCGQWAAQTAQQCMSWATKTAQQCASWATKTSKQCCTWWPCSWGCKLVMVLVSLVCAAFQLVVTVACLLFTLVVIWACLLFALIVTLLCAAVATFEWMLCLLWSLISIVFCISHANGGTAFLLTDGTIMMQECQSFFGANWGTHRWWKLTPDSTGSYMHGSWSRLADSNVGRMYFASAVLADGRVLICGGEYSDESGTNKPDENHSCEIYDPVENTWSFIASPTNPGLPPIAWVKVGDAPCALLPDGQFLMGSIDSPHVAKLDPSVLGWTALKNRSGNSGEESWVLMPDNTIAAPSCVSPQTTWVYHITSDQWKQGNLLPTSIVFAPPNFVAEIGPGLLRYDGTAFFLGGNQHTAIYSPSGKPQWSNGIDLPAQNGKDIGIMDGPASLLVNGNILFGAGPIPIDTKDLFLSPCFYFEFDGSAFNRTNDPPNNDCSTSTTRLLLLPNGDVMFSREGDSAFYSYHSEAAAPQDSFRPVIQTCPPNIQPGSTISISGFQFNGLSQAVAYGDDSQAATNYPLVRILNKQSNHIRYCRTFNHTTVDSKGATVTSMGVATGSAVITTNVSIPGDLELGDSSLVVVANGISSNPFDVTVSAPLEKPEGGGNG